MKQLLLRFILLCTAITTSSVYADDTDIFVSNSGLERANVLFVLDTSESMADEEVLDEHGDSLGRRIDVLKRAFNNLIYSVENVNVGVMGFNASGGAIHQPIANIDEPASRQFHGSIVRWSDDAHEIAGDMYRSFGKVRMGYDPGSTIVRYEGSGSDRRVIVNAEVEFHQVSQQDEATGLELSRPNLDLTSGTVNALRFSDIDIPSVATLDVAELVLTASSNDSESMVMNIRAEKIDSSPALMGDRGDLNNRWNNRSTQTTTVVDLTTTTTADDANETNTVTGDGWQRGDSYKYDVKPLMDELRESSTWNGSEPVSLLMKHASGTGERQAHLVGRVPKLSLTYSWVIGTSSYTGNIYEKITSGLRFDQVGVPKGSRIRQAYLAFPDLERQGFESRPWQLTVGLQNSVSPRTFRDSDSNISSRALLGQVDWEVTRNDDTDYVNVTSLVQRMVNRPRWCAQQPMTFIIEPKDTSNKFRVFARGFEGESNQIPPQLVVEYDAPASTSSCDALLWQESVQGSENDAVQASSGAVELENSSDLSIRSGATIGIRFDGLPIKPGARVVEAYLELSSEMDFQVQIKGEKVLDSQVFTEASHDLTARPVTAASMSWRSFQKESGPFSMRRSPDISDIVQEIIGHADWIEGNALTLFVTKAGGMDALVTSFDSSILYAPRLVLKLEQAGIDPSAYRIKDKLNDHVQSMPTEGLTPIAGSLYEAALYYRGEEVSWGKNRFDNADYIVSDAASYTGGNLSRPDFCAILAPQIGSFIKQCRNERINGSPTYISPITEDCVSNHIVLLTDGVPNSNDSVAEIKSLTGISDCDLDSSQAGEKCSLSLVEWMANHDMANYTQQPTLNSRIMHDVYTHTIAFNLDNPDAVQYLQEVARLGRGGFYSASTVNELTDTFHSVVETAAARGSMFAGGTISINHLNRLEHNNDVYFSLFEPSAQPYWLGNFKKYQMRGNPPVLQGVDDMPGGVLDPDTGFFKAGAKSYWSAKRDGDQVTRGGVASQLPTPMMRKLYTYLPDATLPSLDLARPVNALQTSNPELTADMLNASSANVRQQYIQWLRGVDVLDQNNNGETTDARLQMGGIIHSVPVSVTYRVDREAQTTESRLFIGSNEGFLHSINQTTGVETFGFLPQPLLKNVDVLFNNAPNVAQPYGLDGALNVWIEDHNRDGNIDSDSDHAYLYAGMRRGGRDYYALDVSKMDMPSMLWSKGGIYGGVTPGFEQLGQTWSKPILSQVKVGDEVKQVLMFAGGFDPAVDDAIDTRLEVTQGNAIYMVNAETGRLIWSTQLGSDFADMKYAIPGDLSILDADRDGLADLIFVGDLGGQIWRFDIQHGQSGAGLVRGGVIAQLGGDSALENRQFFVKPNVSRVTIEGNDRWAIAIGSGAINQPLSVTTKDAMFVLYQEVEVPTTYQPVLTRDLHNLTDIHRNTVVSAPGWYIQFDNPGEKVLATSLSLDKSLFFTSYQPAAGASLCSVGDGLGRAYWVDLLRGSAVQDLDGSKSIDLNDRSRVLKTSTLPPAPTIMFGEDGGMLLSVGLEQPYSDYQVLNNGWQMNYWFKGTE